MGQQGSKRRSDPSGIRSKYTFRRLLGKGYYANVRYAVRKSDKKAFAVKIVRKGRLDKKEKQLIRDEVRIMRMLDHPNIVHLYEIFEDDKKLYMVMGLLSGGDLVDAVIHRRLLSESRTAKLVREIASALFYCHQLGVVHRDLKPENILFESESKDSAVQLTDFGLAKYNEDPDVLMKTCCGSPNFVAPEVLLGRGYGPECDLWSLGTTVFTLLVGYRPFDHPERKPLFKSIVRGEYTFNKADWARISPAAKDLVTRLLVVDPKKRITAEGVLMHPWVSGGVASPRALPPVNAEKLRLAKARKQFIMAVNTIVALNRFRMLAKQPTTPANLRHALQMQQQGTWRERKRRARPDLASMVQQSGTSEDFEKLATGDEEEEKKKDDSDKAVPEKNARFLKTSRRRARSAWAVLTETSSAASTAAPSAASSGPSAGPVSEAQRPPPLDVEDDDDNEPIVPVALRSPSPSTRAWSPTTPAQVLANIYVGPKSHKRGNLGRDDTLHLRALRTRKMMLMGAFRAPLPTDLVAPQLSPAGSPPPMISPASLRRRFAADDTSQPRVLAEEQERMNAAAVKGLLEEIERIRNVRKSTSYLFQQVAPGARKVSLTEVRRRTLSAFRQQPSFRERLSQSGKSRKGPEDPSS